MREQRIGGMSVRRRALVATVALAGVVLLALTGGRPSEAAFPGKLGKVVFKRSSPGCCDIWVVDTKGNERRLTFNNYSQGDPSWSADGKLITFRERPVGNQGDIIVMNANGSNQRNLTDDGVFNDDEPNFTPDRKRIIFESNRPNVSLGDTDIYSMKASDGSGITPITTTNSSISEYEPAISPNGKLIAFTRNDGGESDIWVMSASGKHPRPLAASDTLGEMEPNFSSDGKLIAFDAYDGTHTRIYVQKLAGGEPRVLTTDDADSDSPTFSPNNKLVVYDRSTPMVGNDRIATVPVAGGPVNFFTDATDESQTPDWGPIPVKCGGKRSTIVGTPGKDKLFGTPDADVIAGLGGRDTLIGKGGNDRLCGGKGPDKLIGKGGRDRLFGGGRRDRCVGGGGRDHAVSCEIQASI